MEFLNITKVNNNYYIVKTKYNQFFILVDETKGIGIYLDFGDNNQLIKSYKHKKIETAINYLLKKYF
jgi:hypothetical protein